MFSVQISVDPFILTCLTVRRSFTHGKLKNLSVRVFQYLCVIWESFTMPCIRLSMFSLSADINIKQNTTRFYTA